MRGFSDLLTPPAGASAEALRETYLWIEAYITKHGYPPTTHEIAAGLHLTDNGIYRRLKLMEARGWIVRSGKKRDIELLGTKN